MFGFLVFTRAPGSDFISISPLHHETLAFAVMRSEVNAAVWRVRDGVIIAQVGDILLIEQHAYQMYHDFTEAFKNEEEKALSKSSFQERKSDFDPPVRDRGREVQKPGKLVPTGNISHFEEIAVYNGHQWVTENRIMRDAGYTFRNGGFSTHLCKNCGSDCVLGMGVYLNGVEDDLWIDACAGCGWAWMERAIPEMKVCNA